MYYNLSTISASFLLPLVDMTSRWVLWWYPLLRQIACSSAVADPGSLPVYCTWDSALTADQRIFLFFESTILYSTYEAGF